MEKTKENFDWQVFMPARFLIIMLGVNLCMAQSIPSGTAFCIQAESVSPSSPWEFRTEKEGYYGAGYFYYNATDYSGGSLSYQFDITEAGQYVIELRGRRDKEGLCENARSDECNDVYTSITDNWTDCKSMIKGTSENWNAWSEWIWQSHIAHDAGCGQWNDQPLIANLSSGINTFTLEGRSRGICFDAFMIYPVGQNRPENLCDHATSRLPHEKTGFNSNTAEKYRGAIRFNSDKMTIDIRCYSPCIIRIFNAKGALVYAVSRTSSGTIHLQNKTFSPGVYLLRMNHTDDIITRRMLIK